MTCAVAAACGTSGEPPTGAEPASMVVTNRSQFDLVEFRAHRDESYLEEESLLDNHFAVDDSLVLYGRGSWYFTVYRERYRLGPVYAFTTATPVFLEPDVGYTFSIFDESFRLEESPWLAPDEAKLPVIELGD